MQLSVAGDEEAEGTVNRFQLPRYLGSYDAFGRVDFELSRWCVFVFE